MKGYVYLIENKINGHKYVGKTYNTIQERWHEHLKDAKREDKADRPIYRAINKYGANNFTISQLDYCENCEEREKYWIAYYDTYHNGYNATLGGDGKAYFEHSDEEVIAKFNELNQNIRETAKFFECDKNTITVRLKNNGIDITPGGNIYNEKRNWVAKKVNQYSLEGIYIQGFDTMKQAAEQLIENKYTTGQVKHIVSNISKNIRGIEGRKQAYGFIWKDQ